MATGNFGAQCILKIKGKQKGIIYKKVSICRGCAQRHFYSDKVS